MATNARSLTAFVQTMHAANAQDAADRAAQAKLDAYIIADLTDDERETLLAALENEAVTGRPSRAHHIEAAPALDRAGLVEHDDVVNDVLLTPRGARIARKLAA
jgi:hypothetical protein